MNSEKFCLKWDDFQNNIAGSIKDLKEDFCDVTLASEGNEQIEAHRVILAASSPLLRDMLRKSRHSHPLLYMRRIKSKDLLNVVNFIYHGEVNIFQEDLNDFLSLAEELELKGLTGSDQPPEGEQQMQGKSDGIKDKAQSSVVSPFLEDNKQPLRDMFDDFDGISTDSVRTKTTAVIPIHQQENYKVSRTGKLNEKVYSLIEKREGIWTCKVCGKTPARNISSEIARHAEVHLEGVSHTCNQCGTVARSSHALTCHVSKYHRV